MVRVFTDTQDIGSPSAALAVSTDRRFQKTLQNRVELHGPGLFHGIDAHVTLNPADAGYGIVFQRTDLADSPRIPALWSSVAHAPRRTVLASAPNVRVETVEHLLSALAGLQIDNCHIEITGPEVPAFDGSCQAFCEAVFDAGTCELSSPAAIYRPACVVAQHDESGRQSLLLRPYLRPLAAVTYHLDYGRRGQVPPQTYSIELTPESFYHEIAAARTFVLESEIAALRSLGYGKHLKHRDLLVVGSGGVIGNQLRWADEFVRHKILDCVGDLALSGLEIQGHLTAWRSGHQLNHRLAKAVQADSARAWSRAA
ncbi:MAG: UDP-3-O-acyl-N-acetylglucosamine deacetylase [Planctomycetaceae bacterium]